MNNGEKIMKRIYPKKDHKENKTNPKEKVQIKLIKNQLDNHPQKKQINHKEKKRNQKAYQKMLKKKKLRKNRKNK